MKVKKSQSAENEWIKMAIRKIKAHEGLRQREIAERVGVNWQHFSGVANGRYALTDTIKDKLFYQFPYLSNGEGEMLNEPSADVSVQGGLPLYNVEGTANLVSLHMSQERQDIIGHIKVPNMPKCDYAVFVSGDSMAPLLKAGDIVAVKVVPNEPQSIIYGEMYLISLDAFGDEYLTIKFIHRSEKGDEWVKLTSYNEFYEPKDFHLSTIRSMAIVKFSIRKQTMI